MTSARKGRREFIVSVATGAVAAGGVRVLGARQPTPDAAARPPRLKFAAIGMNHGHINGQTESVIRGGGQLVSFYAKEPDLAAAFGKRFPQARLVGSEREILEDPSIQLIVSASIPDGVPIVSPSDS